MSNRGGRRERGVGGVTSGGRGLVGLRKRWLGKLSSCSLSRGLTCNTFSVLRWFLMALCLPLPLQPHAPVHVCLPVG